jgi:hypothetical protein
LNEKDIEAISEHGGVGDVLRISITVAAPET